MVFPESNVISSVSVGFRASGFQLRFRVESSGFRVKALFGRFIKHYQEKLNLHDQQTTQQILTLEAGFWFTGVALPSCFIGVTHLFWGARSSS